MKGFFKFVFASIGFSLTFASFAFAFDSNIVLRDNLDIKVLVNNKEVYFEQKPIMINDVVMVPMRPIFESLGASVYWNDDSQTAFVSKGFRDIKFGIDNNIMRVDDKKVYLDVAPIYYNYRTFVPLRAISLAFASDVSWNQDTYTVSIKSNNTQGDWLRTRDYTLEEEYKNSDDKVVAKAIASVPRIYNTKDYAGLDSINDYYVDIAKKFMTNSSDFSNPYSIDILEMAKNKIVIKNGIDNTNLIASLSYNIGYEANGVFSVVLTYYTRSGLSRPDKYIVCDTFNMVSGNKLEAWDILNMSKDDVIEMVIQEFTSMINSSKDCFYNSALDDLEDVVNESLQFYIADNAIHFVLPKYSIAPYEYGIPSFSISLDNTNLFVTDFTDTTDYAELENAKTLAIDYAKRLYEDIDVSSLNPVIVDKCTMDDVYYYIVKVEPVGEIFAVTRSGSKTFRKTNSFAGMY